MALSNASLVIVRSTTIIFRFYDPVLIFTAHPISHDLALSLHSLIAFLHASFMLWYGIQTNSLIQKNSVVIQNLMLSVQFE